MDCLWPLLYCILSRDCQICIRKGWWFIPVIVTPLFWRPCSASTAAPLRQLLCGSSSTTASYGRTYTAAPLRQPVGFRPLTPSRSFCGVKLLQPRQLACSSAGVQLLPAALPPSCGPPCRHHSAPVLSCGPCCHNVASAAIMRPLPPSSSASLTLSHCNPFSWPVLQLGCSCLFLAALAAIMRPLPP
jgi:hypothetical protein